tara:strand:- start:15957 stop:16181 length:225 start_codon:yes stop_codon:yes gene_type:complete
LDGYLDVVTHQETTTTRTEADKIVSTNAPKAQNNAPLTDGKHVKNNPTVALIGANQRPVPPDRSAQEANAVKTA